MSERIDAVVPTGTNGAPMVRETTSAAVGVVGDLIAACGDPGQSAALKGAAPMIGYLAERGFIWAHGQARRIAESLDRTGRRAAEEGLNLETTADVIEQAIPVLGDEACEEKRRMIEEIVLNSARRADDPRTSAAAICALDLIAKMPTEAALVFGAIVALHPKFETNEYGVLKFTQIDRADIGELTTLPYFLYHRAMEHLCQCTEDGSRKNPPDTALVAYSKRTKGAGPDERKIPGAVLCHPGGWLATWITNNPSGDPAASAQAPQPG